MMCGVSCIAYHNLRLSRHDCRCQEHIPQPACSEEPLQEGKSQERGAEEGRIFLQGLWHSEVTYIHEEFGQLLFNVSIF